MSEEKKKKEKSKKKNTIILFLLKIKFCYHARINLTIKTHTFISLDCNRKKKDDDLQEKKSKTSLKNQPYILQVFGSGPLIKVAFSTSSNPIILITAWLISATYCSWIVNIMDYTQILIDRVVVAAALCHSKYGIYWCGAEESKNTHPYIYQARGPNQGRGHVRGQTRSVIKAYSCRRRRQC